MAKTVHVLRLIEDINRRNRVSTVPPDVRCGWNAMLETVLHNADVYMGYRYLPEDMVPENEKPGIIHSPAGITSFPDETRREYFVHYSLTKRG